jgi:hypothetical protein
MAWKAFTGGDFESLARFEFQLRIHSQRMIGALKIDHA